MSWKPPPNEVFPYAERPVESRSASHAADDVALQVFLGSMSEEPTVGMVREAALVVIRERDHAIIAELEYCASLSLADRAAYTYAADRIRELTSEETMDETTPAAYQLVTSVEAVHWHGEREQFQQLRLSEWLGPNVTYFPPSGQLVIQPALAVNVGDWILKYGEALSVMSDRDFRSKYRPLAR